MDETANMRGVYAIYIEDELVYIGKTNQSFGARFKAHKRHVCDGTDSPLYNEIRKAKIAGKQVNFRPIVKIEDLHLYQDSRDIRCDINNRDIECMELALITYLQPRCNQQGVNKPYPLHRI